MNITFQPPSSSFSPNFWESLYNLKLNNYKLDSSPQPIRAHFAVSSSSGGSSSKPNSVPNPKAENISIEFDEHSFINNAKDLSYGFAGSLLNFNTIEV